MSKLKQTIADNGGFRHWFVNVFWFHYKWPLLIIVAVIGIVGYITFDSMRRDRYDTTVVIATDYYVDDTALDALDEVLKPAIGDLDGNGVVKINYAVVFLGDTELGQENEERMYLYMTQDDVALYLMSGNISDAYTNPLLEYFTDDLSNYGLPCDEDNPVRYHLENNPALEESGLEDIYLSIMDYSAIRDTAVSAAQALIAAGEDD